jgi:integrase/recombinase XerD
MRYQFKRRPLSIHDQERLVKTCKGDRERVLIEGLLETGLRISEFCYLRKEDFNWEDGAIIVNGKAGPFGKVAKLRAVPITDRARSIFKKFFVIIRKKSYYPRGAQRLVKKIGERAGLLDVLTPHILRHTFAVNCIRRGIGIVSIQKALGHDSLLTTQIYTNLQPQDMLNEFSKKGNKDLW